MNEKNGNLLEIKNLKVEYRTDMEVVSAVNNPSAPDSLKMERSCSTEKIS